MTNSNPLVVNDGSQAAPKLQIHLNLDSLDSLRAGSSWSGATGAARWEQLAHDGFEGVQFTDDSQRDPAPGFAHCGLGRINVPGESDPLAAKHAALGDRCLTVHVGWGIECDDAVFRLVESVLAASQKHRIPIFIETHRATITQDMWRTVQMTKKFPEVRFNGDFSHYYCGQEMVYGGLEMKMDFMAPIFDRVGFLHGRVASPGGMQFPVSTPGVRPSAATGLLDYQEHFERIWERAMEGFLQSAGAGDILIFAPELLAGTHYYARLFQSPSGNFVEETDRYEQAKRLAELARRCFERARAKVA